MVFYPIEAHLDVSAEPVLNITPMLCLDRFLGMHS